MSNSLPIDPRNYKISRYYCVLVCHRYLLFTSLFIMVAVPYDSYCRAIKLVTFIKSDLSEK